MAWQFGVVLVLLCVEGWMSSTAVEYKMDGGAYIVYSLPSKAETSPPKSYQPMVHMLFRTAKPSCLLIHGRGKSGDFFTVELVRGKLRYASVFDRTGSRKPGYYDVTVGDDLGDDQWHQIDIERRGNHVVIKLDITKRYLIPRNARKSLNINLDVSVGGLRGRSMDVSADPSLPNVTLTGVVFEGCLEDVTYDKENILRATKEKSKYIKVIGNLRPKCSEDKEYFPPATLTTSSSFIRLNIAERKDLNLTFKFRTFEHSGILVHHTIGSPDNVSLLLELVGGKLRLNLSSKFFKTDVNLLARKTPSLANGLWHKIELNFSNEEITVQVNNEVFQKFLNVTQRVGHLSRTKAVLSIGSVLPTKNSIIGCIKEIDLNGMKDVIVTSGMTKNVFIDKCFLVDQCFSNPCLNNGRCLQYNNTAQCDCFGTGYEGLQCEQAVQIVHEATKIPGSLLRSTPMSSMAQSITTNIPQGFSVRQTKSLINQPSTMFPSSVPLNLISKNVSKPSMNVIASLTSGHVVLSSSKPTVASFIHPTYSTIITSASSVNNFQPTTRAFPVNNTITPLLTNSVTSSSVGVVKIPSSSVGVVKIPTTERTTRKNDQRVIIIEKRNEVTTVGLNKHQWLVYLFLCVVFLLLVGLIVIISVKLSRLSFCRCFKRFTQSGRESLSRQDAMEFDQQDAKEDIDSGIDRSDSGVASSRSSANEETAVADQRDAEIWLDCEVTILESSNESFLQRGFLVLQEGPLLYTQQTFGWSVMESSADRINQPHHRSPSYNDTSQNDDAKEISTNVEDDVAFVTSPEQRHATTRYHQLCGEDSSSLENIYVDMKQCNTKRSEEEELCR